MIKSTFGNLKCGLKVKFIDGIKIPKDCNKKNAQTGSTQHSDKKNKKSLEKRNNFFDK